jgi:hypothetical protein
MSICFVIMPIRREGSEEYFHFRTIYDEYILPIVTPYGFEKVIRADDIHKSGAITQDIIVQLATAELVVADLTDLNPNVFYELGVRHSLRGRGTILVLDEGRTADVPFDLSAYRVIKFKSDLQGISKLRQGLKSYLDVLAAAPVDGEERDNPVHHWLPSLPVDALSAAVGSEAGQLRQRIAEISGQLRNYESRFGKSERKASDLDDLAQEVHGLLQQAREGMLGPDLVRSAHESVKRQDKPGYVEALYRITQDSSIRLSPHDYMVLAYDAQSLGLPEAKAKVLRLGTLVHPSDDQLRRAKLSESAQSYNPAERQMAREELGAETGISIRDGNVIPPERLDKKAGSSLGIMLDAYHADNLSQEALAITTALMDKFPDRTVVVRNHARALEETGAECIEFYQRAIWCLDCDDTSAQWFASELRSESRHVDALEAFAVAAMLDNDDGTHFAYAADQIGIGLDEREYPVYGSNERRVLPDTISADTLQKAVQAALSCEQLDQKDVDRCMEAVTRAGMDSIFVTELLQMRANGSDELAGSDLRRLRRGERRAFALHLYEELKSAVTSPPAGVSHPTLVAAPS